MAAQLAEMYLSTFCSRILQTQRGPAAVILLLYPHFRSIAALPSRNCFPRGLRQKVLHSTVCFVIYHLPVLSGLSERLNRMQQVIVHIHFQTPKKRVRKVVEQKNSRYVLRISSVEAESSCL